MNGWIPRIKLAVEISDVWLSTMRKLFNLLELANELELVKETKKTIVLRKLV